MNALPSFIPPAAPSRLFRCRHEVQPRRARRVAFAIRSCATEPQESIAADSADSAHDEKADAPGAVLDRTWCTALNSLRSEQLYAFYTEIDSKYQPRLSNVFSLGRVNFGLELRESLQSVQRMFGFSLPEAYSPPSCLGFELSNAAIAARERAREERDGVPDAWPLVRLAYSSVCFVLDVAYGKRPIERFWVLETVARLPYQAYSSCLHLLSTLGWFRSPTLMNMHHAEDLNEAYHLAVMESLGGDQRWVDRFTAFHVSLFYFWILVVLFFVSPKQSYAFSQLLESHAVDTYEAFLEENESTLKLLPVPEVAHVYFNDFLFYYYEFRASDSDASSALDYADRGRPKLESLFDVFQNILSDEREHSTAMEACVEYVETGEPVKYNGRVVSGRSRQIKMSAERRREFWKRWEEIRRKRDEGND